MPTIKLYEILKIALFRKYAYYYSLHLTCFRPIFVKNKSWPAINNTSNPLVLQSYPDQTMSHYQPNPTPPMDPQGLQPFDQRNYTQYPPHYNWIKSILYKQVPQGKKERLNIPRLITSQDLNTLKRHCHLAHGENNSVFVKTPKWPQLSSSYQCFLSDLASAVIGNEIQDVSWYWTLKGMLTSLPWLCHTALS